MIFEGTIGFIWLNVVNLDRIEGNLMLPYYHQASLYQEEELLAELESSGCALLVCLK